MPPAQVRLIVAREAVIELVGPGGARSVTVRVPPGPSDHAVLRADGRTDVEALVVAPDRVPRERCGVSLAGRLFARAVAATVGRHVRLDIAGELDPVVLTTPDQPAFTALVMPQRP